MKEPKTFVIVGASGYIAKRHIETISKVGGKLLATYDPSDQIGIIDSFFKDVEHFNDFHFFNEWMEDNIDIDYFVICSPNYTHYFYIQYALSFGIDVICEKPLVVNYKQVDRIISHERESGCKIYPILQARTHPKIQWLKDEMRKPENKDKKYEVECLYMSNRGKWYDKSWKGDKHKSGGVLMNIGIHLFDVLFYLFDHYMSDMTHPSSISFKRESSGNFSFKNAKIKYHVSINERDLPEGYKVIRQLKIREVGKQEWETIEFSDGFFMLHRTVYDLILNGKWNIDLNELKIPLQLTRTTFNGV